MSRLLIKCPTLAKRSICIDIDRSLFIGPLTSCFREYGNKFVKYISTMYCEVSRDADVFDWWQSIPCSNDVRYNR